MKSKLALGSLLVTILFLFSQCDKLKDLEEMGGTTFSGKFKVTIENVQAPKLFFASGVFNTPVGDNSPGNATPGKYYEFSFYAGKGQRLSFTTMFGRSNEAFFAPDGKGLQMWNGDTPLSGDITPMVYLWDSGTQVNEAPGMAVLHTPESVPVMLISQVNDGFTWPTVASVIKVTVFYEGTTKFKVRVEDVIGAFTPLSPGTWVIHTADYPVFQPGTLDRGQGLAPQSQMGDPTKLGQYLADNSGLVTPISPGVWTITKAGEFPLFKKNHLDYGDGLKYIAQGDPTALAAWLATDHDLISTGVYNTPVGASAPNKLFPGDKFEFIVSSKNNNDYLSFASMFGESNDLFFAPSDKGISLWNGKNPIYGDITSQIILWDDGTEVNEYPGAGNNQPARGPGGIAESDPIVPVYQVNDGFTYPTIPMLIKVTITPQ